MFQRLRGQTDAVSPVIATIVLVAIAVTMSGVVFMMVSVFTNERQEATPAVGLEKNSDAGTLQVVKVVSQASVLKWEDLEVSGCSTAGLSGAVDPSDRLTGCSGDVTIVHTPTKSLLFVTNF